MVRLQKYLLYPPFLVVEEENNFPDMWEVFCLKLLKLDLKTNSIVRRTPPEQGVDLYYRDNKIAYQCKCVINENNKFNVTNTINSITKAISIKTSLPWDTFTLCLNVNLSGKQEKSLRAFYPTIDIKTKDYWVDICERYPDQVRRNFCIVTKISDIDILRSERFLLSGFKNNLAPQFSDSDNVIHILLYSEQNSRISKIPIPTSFTLKEFHQYMGILYNLQEYYSANYGEFKIITTINIKGRKILSSNITDNKTLLELGINDGDIIGFEISLVSSHNPKLTYSALWLNEQSTFKEEKAQQIVSEIFLDFNNYYN
ncbi:hypothetical protein [Paenibacillus sp. 481]|uniref:hypothetical protein n=1 Tax=Paenibacillus sp. 481 TaxID=2835869 RepID=UPI001E33CA93|nr:hypothetical protein [Paenibacillus sp. 481]UHA72048.1 hypothetical protein KIK04_15180 [Paenibacillus sp. 481]